jgi:hypothetical protein
VDAVEVNGEGRPLHDITEATAAIKVFGSETAGRTIAIGSVKSNMQWGKECAGMAQFFKVLNSLHYFVSMPNIHLRELNSQLDLPETAMLSSEAMTMARGQNTTNQVCVVAHGWGGANVGLNLASVEGSRPGFKKNEADQQVSLADMPFSYWPGGNVVAEDDSAPDRVYTITGSWSGWKPEEMQWQGGSTYSYTLTFGENCYENFQIWLDGNPEKVLHPLDEHATGGTGACFTDTARFTIADEDDVQGGDEPPMLYSWLLDGRKRVQEEVDPETGETLTFQLVHPISEEPLPEEDEGKPGDRYHICLHAAGTYRMVDWEKLPTASSVPTDKVVPSTAKYHVVSTWNGWSFDEMQPVEGSPGSFYLDVRLDEEGGEFQIVRNQDWNQVFWPSEFNDTSGPGPYVDRLNGWNWNLDGKPGDKFRIEFTRAYAFGVDTTSTSWRKL